MKPYYDHAGQTIYCGDCREVLTGLTVGSVDLVFGSPPYPEKGERYGAKARPWPWAAWVDWMVEITLLSLRASRGPVLWVVNNAVRRGRYLPATEALVLKAVEAGIVAERPCIWHKNAPPNRRDWFGNNWESILAFKHSGSVPYWNWAAVGAPPKYQAGGRFRQRGKDGKRKLGNEYPKNRVTRPRDVFRVTVGGGHLGSPLAHENEAPFPEKLVEPFVLALCPPGGTVLDPFSGSGTTAAVACRLGRKAIAIEIRESQCELAKRRLETEVLGLAGASDG